MKLSTKLFVSAAEVAMIKESFINKTNFVAELPNLGETVSEKDFADIEELFSAFQVKFKVSNSFHNLAYLFRFKDKIEMDFELEVDTAVLAAILEYDKVIFELMMPVIDSVYAVFKALPFGEMCEKFKVLNEKHEHLFKNMSKEASTESGDVVK